MAFDFQFISTTSEQQNNTLIQYIQKQHPDILARIAQSASQDIKQIISQNVAGLLGTLPGENFNVQITTDRDDLANLLASAMMTGYFLAQVEQRKDLDLSFSDTDSLNRPA
jgi:23S rRNA G2069 N7-methylase RlmK/C1962 C5-methylase RlmI